jgi:hypothetical protein
LSGCPDEWLALLILVKSRCLPHEHDGCMRIADAEDDLASTELGERAALAIVKRLGEFLQGGQG